MLNSREQTGFSVDILEIIFSKYGGIDTPIKTRKSLSQFLEFCKSYGTYRAFTYTRQKHFFRSTFTTIKRILNYLFVVVDELDNAYLNRFSSLNSVNIGINAIDNSTLIVDTFPIYISRPSSDQNLFYNGKYKGHVLKVQVFCDHQANIVFYSGPHLGCTHDVQIFYDNHSSITVNEKILADKAYCGNRAKQMGIIAPHKRTINNGFSAEQSDFNAIHGFYRSRMEHAIGYLKRFSILSQRYRGRIIGQSCPNISKFVKVLIHLNYMQTYKYPIRHICEKTHGL